MSEQPVNSVPAHIPSSLDPDPEALLRRRLKTVIIGTVLLTGLLGLVSWRILKQRSQDADRFAHTFVVLARLDLTLRHLLDVGTGSREFALTGLEPLLQPYESGKDAAAVDLQLLRILIVHPEQKRRLDGLDEQVKSALDTAAELVAARQSSAAPPITARFIQLNEQIDAVRVRIRELQAEEKRLLEQDTQRTRGLKIFIRLAFALAALSMVIFLAATGVRVSREIRITARAQAQVKTLNADLKRRKRQHTKSLGEEAAAHQQTESKLRASEAMYQMLLDGITDYAVYMLDREGCVVTWNSGAARITGYPKQEIIGQHFSCFYTITDRESRHPEKSLQEAADMGRFEGEGWRVRKDGTRFWANALITPLFDANGNLSGYSKVVRDITARKQAAEMREQLAAVVESSDDAIISKTLDGTIAAWNRGAEKVFGYPTSEAVGRPILMLIPADRADEELSILARIRRGQSIEHFETERVRKDGTNIHVSVTISPIRNAQGEIVGASKIARDITDRKRSEEVLRQTDERRRFALETAKLGDWELDLTTMEATRSLRHDQIFGYPALLPQWNFDTFFGHVHPDDRKAGREDFERCVKQRTRWELECRIIRTNGDLRWIWACGDHYRHSAGSTTRMFGIVEDVTERRQAFEALRQGEEQFQAVANGIPQLAWMAEADGSISWYNRRWYEFTGTTLDQMLARGWPSVLDPDHLPPVMEGWKSAIAAGESFDMEFPLRGADGLFRTFLTRVMPVNDAQGCVVRWFGTHTDISERKRAEERLTAQAAELLRSRQSLEAQQLMMQSVLNSMVEGLVAVDETGKLILSNPAAERLIGPGAADVLTEDWSARYGAFLPDMITPFPNEQNPLLRAIHGEVSSASIFFLNPVFNHAAWIESNGSPLRDKDGVVRGGLIAFRDITQRKANELEIGKLNGDLGERIAERTAQLEIANTELSAFSYSVSHDLRAPLRHISGFSRILINDFGPGMAAEARGHLLRIEEAVIRMGHLVDGMLSLATLGRQPLKLRRTDLNTIVDQLVSLLQPECEGRDVQWRIAPLPALDCDRVLVGQVFQNLLGNALKYSRGRPSTVIEVGSTQQPGQPAVIFVRDNGAGFNMKYAGRLFEVFQRMHPESEFEGTGVGLATVHRIIQKHGGSIWAEAEPEQGATFYFTLGGKHHRDMTPDAVAAGK